MTEAPRLAVLATLKDQIEKVLAGRLSPEQPFALLDFPDHSNIGDSAIYCGEISYLQSRGLRAAYAASIEEHRWDLLDRAVPDGPILLHGGGNFGDVWPAFQRFREEVMARYPGRPVIQLPQTIKFDTQDSIDRTARAIEAHGAFTLLVRDQRSYDLATKSFQCEVLLSPDMAFHMGPLKRDTPTLDLLLHMRTDHEAAAKHDVSPFEGQPGVKITDWPAEPRGFRKKIQAAAYVGGTIRGEIGTAGLGLQERFLSHLAQRRVDRGTALLGSAERVVTDRLHGHILSLLLGVPHCVLDNNYGKVSGFMSAWGTEVGQTWTAKSLAEAVERLDAERLTVAA